MTNVISHAHQREWVCKQREIDAELSAQSKKSFKDPAPTKASQAHAYKPVQEKTSTFKLKQFQNAESKVKILFSTQ